MICYTMAIESGGSMIFSTIKRLSGYLLLALSIFIFATTISNLHVSYPRYSIVNMSVTSTEVLASETQVEARSPQAAEPTSIVIESTNNPDYQLLALPFSALALVFAILYLKKAKKDYEN